MGPVDRPADTVLKIGEARVKYIMNKYFALINPCVFVKNELCVNALCNHPKTYDQRSFMHPHLHAYAYAHADVEAPTDCAELN